MNANHGLEQEIQERLDVQNRWRRVMSGAYFVTSAVAIAASGAATVVSGIGFAEAGAVLAGTATVLLSIEKAMLFREKWAHHLSTAMQLDALKLAYEYGSKTEPEVVEQVGEILSSYAVKLPISRREARVPQ